MEFVSDGFSGVVGCESETLGEAGLVLGARTGLLTGRTDSGARAVLVAGFEQGCA